jgi:hypothetical protein
MLWLSNLYSTANKDHTAVVGGRSSAIIIIPRIYKQLAVDLFIIDACSPGDNIEKKKCVNYLSFVSKIMLCERCSSVCAVAPRCSLLRRVFV